MSNPNSAGRAAQHDAACPSHHHSVRQRLSRHKPKLLGFFDAAVAVTASARASSCASAGSASGATRPAAGTPRDGGAPLSDGEIDALATLALVSESVYIDPGTLLPLVMHRGELVPFAEILQEAARAGFRYAGLLTGRYPDFPFRITQLATEMVEFLRALQEHDRRRAGHQQRFSGLPGRRRRGQNGIDGRGTSGIRLFTLCLDAKGEHEARFLLRSLTVIVQYVPSVAAEFLELVRQAYAAGKERWDLISQWMARGIDLISSSRTEEGIAHLKLESDESRRMLGLSYVVLADVRNVLMIYGASIAGRSVAVQDWAASSFGIETPFTDGRALFLPPRIHYFAERRDNETVYACTAALQAQAVAGDTFRFHIESIPFLDDVRERYATVLPDIMESVRRYYGRSGLGNPPQSIRERTTGEVELLYPGERNLQILTTHHEDFFYMFPTPDLFRQLFSFFETCRLEWRLGSRYPGLREDAALLQRRLWARRRGVTATPEDPTRELEVVIEALVQWSLMGRVKWMDPDRDDVNRLVGAAGSTAPHAGGADEGATGTATATPGLAEPPGRARPEERLAERVAAVVGELDTVRRDGATVTESMLAAFRVYNVLYEAYPVIPYCAANDIRTLFAGTGRGEIFPELAFDVSPELFADREQHVIMREHDAEEEVTIDLASAGEIERKNRRIKQARIEGSLSVHSYPEFDVDRGSYRRRFCRVYESYGERGDPAFYTELLRRNQRLHKRIRKRFLLMEQEEVSVSRKWIDGDDIHLEDAVDFATNLLRGDGSDDKLYQRKILNVRDIACAVLVDASSSTEELVAGRRIIDIEKDAIALLGSALSVIGDAFAVYSFFSMGRSNVFFSTPKRFADPWNSEAIARVGGIQANAGNRDGAAIRHATARLAERPEKTRLLVLLSDGIPADAGYGGATGADTSRYAIEDTRRAILEARRHGVRPFCITVDRFAKSYVSYLYGDRNHARIQSIAQLPEKLSRVYMRVTA
ncbi:MAG: nitric oxide reductase activation protein NorD [Spirochaetaceae bacterium]